MEKSTAFVLRSGPASRRLHHGVWVLNLFGSRSEMARQHGELARDRISRSALSDFMTRLRVMATQSPAARAHPAAAHLIRFGMELMVNRPFRGLLPREDRKTLRAFALGAGLNPRDVMNGMALPDAGNWGLARLFGGKKRRRLSSVLAGAIPPSDLGCSSFVIPATKTTRTLFHARNLDYEGFGAFEDEPALVVYHPDGPGEQAYASFTSLGVHTAGISGVNESGLFLGLHQTLVNQTSRRGSPVLSVTERVIREARTLDDARALLSGARFATAWKIILSSSVENRALSAEVSAQGAHFRDMGPNDPPLIETNHVWSRSMKADEFTVNDRYAADSRLRRRGIRSALNTALKKGPLTEQDAIDILASPFSHDGGDRGLHGCPAKPNNVQSVLVMMREKTAFLAIPDVPGSKPSTGRFVPLPLDFKTMESETGLERVLKEAATREGLRCQDVQAGKTPEKYAHAALRRASNLASLEGRFAEAAETFEEAARLQPTVAVYPLLASLYWIKAAGEATGRAAAKDRERALEKAENQLKSAVTKNPSDYHRHLAALATGWAADLGGRRTEARKAYAEAARCFSPRVRQCALKRRRSPYRSADARRLTIDAIHGDFFRA